MNPVTTADDAKKTNTAQANPLRALTYFGQSVWLDYIRRNLFTSGELQRLITEDGLRGMTSNPAIFQKPIAGSSDYVAILHELNAQNMSTRDIYASITISGIHAPANL